MRCDAAMLQGQEIIEAKMTLKYSSNTALLFSICTNSKIAFVT